MTDDPRVRPALKILGGLVLAINLLLLLAAIVDRGLGAMIIALIVAPEVNAGLVVAALLFTPLVRSVGLKASIGRYVLASFLFPVLGTAAVCLTILAFMHQM